ncbi:MAG: DUF1643 domain-containing protein [Phycisphaerales bacterium]|nr:DUF1643 domain-containing protein [Phycisphaerales bacterium]
MRGTASFSPCRKYRYSLTRVWDADRARVCFCMLNPSTADAQKFDPTVRRCYGFALDWGFGSMEVVNVCAYRATRPSDLHAQDEPMGAGNPRAIRRACARAKLVIAAWGNEAIEHPTALSHAERALMEHDNVRCFGLTGKYQPKHPLYIAAATKPVVFAPMAVATSVPA